MDLDLKGPLLNKASNKSPVNENKASFASYNLDDEEMDHVEDLSGSNENITTILAKAKAKKDAEIRLA